MDERNNAFVELSEVLKQSTEVQRRHSPPDVLKSGQYRATARVRTVSNQPKPQSRVKPVYSNGAIVGIELHCQCGEKHVVYFRYEKAPAPRDA